MAAQPAAEEEPGERIVCVAAETGPLHVWRAVVQWLHGRPPIVLDQHWGMDQTSPVVRAAGLQCSSGPWPH
eukprot:6484370-Amphidinium_carterae.4